MTSSAMRVILARATAHRRTPARHETLGEHRGRQMGVDVGDRREHRGVTHVDAARSRPPRRRRRRPFPSHRCSVACTYPPAAERTHATQRSGSDSAVQRRSVIVDVHLAGGRPERFASEQVEDAGSPRSTISSRSAGSRSRLNSTIGSTDRVVRRQPDRSGATRAGASRQPSARRSRRRRPDCPRWLSGSTCSPSCCRIEPVASASPDGRHGLIEHEGERARRDGPAGPRRSPACRRRTAGGAAGLWIAPAARTTWSASMISPSTSSTAHARRPSSTTRRRPRHRCAPPGCPGRARDRDTRRPRSPCDRRGASAEPAPRRRRREQRPVDRSELDLRRQRGRDQHPLPRLVDVVPAPRCVDRRVAAQRHHRVHRTRPAEAAAPHIRQRRAARRTGGGDGRQTFDPGNSTAAKKSRPAERHRGLGIVGLDPPRGGRPIGQDPRSVGTPPRTRPNRHRRPPTSRSPSPAHRRCHVSPAPAVTPSPCRGVESGSPARCAASL